MHQEFDIGDGDRSGEEYADQYEDNFDQFDQEYVPMGPFDTAEELFGCEDQGECEDVAAEAEQSAEPVLGPYHRAEQYLISLFRELRNFGKIKKLSASQHFLW